MEMIHSGGSFLLTRIPLFFHFCFVCFVKQRYLCVRQPSGAKI